MTYVADKEPTKTVGDVAVHYLVAGDGEQGGHEARFSDGWRIRVLPEAPTPTTSGQKRSRALTEALTALSIRTPAMIPAGEPSRSFVKAYLTTKGVTNVVVLAPTNPDDFDGLEHPVNEVRVVGVVAEIAAETVGIQVREGHDLFRFRVASFDPFAGLAGVSVGLADEVAITGRLVRRAVATPAGVRYTVLIEPRVVVNRTTGEMTS